jgi:excisionase family DNA binding protein
MRTWFTVMQAAEYTGLSRDTIYTACERHEIRHARVGGRRAIRLKRNGSMRGSNDMCWTHTIGVWSIERQ